MKEIFKDIKDYEGLYQVSNLGRVYSFITNKFLKPNLNKNGYLTLHLKGSSKQLKLHRLVAETFILNTNNFPCVNHKDEDKTNNCVDNLEWCSYKYNNNYGTMQQRGHIKLSKPILMLDLNGRILKEFSSIHEATRYLGKKNSGYLSSICNNENKTAYGYKWKYK